MNAPTWPGRLLCAMAVALGLCLVGPSSADDKVKKGSGKGKDEKNVLVIPLDLSKAPPVLVKQLTEPSRSTGRDGDKAKGARKGGDDGKRRDDRKPDAVQVDLNELPAGLAKRLRAELGQSKDDGKKGARKDDDDEARRMTEASGPHAA